jgi:hypothetical protein
VRVELPLVDSKGGVGGVGGVGSGECGVWSRGGVVGGGWVGVGSAVDGVKRPLWVGEDGCQQPASSVHFLAVVMQDRDCGHSAAPLWMIDAAVELQTWANGSFGRRSHFVVGLGCWLLGWVGLRLSRW